MRILWYSSSPECRTAYGIVTKELVRRLREAGHFVRVATKHEYQSEHIVDGLEIINGTNLRFLDEMIKIENFDYIFTFTDLWCLKGKRSFPKKKWVAYTPPNTMKMMRSMKEVLQLTGYQIAMTKFGLEQYRGEGFTDAVYAPHGLNTHNYRPDEGAGLLLRQDAGWGADNFVIGEVGINYEDDVKGFIPLMRAFRKFHDHHPEARLFLCTLANENDVYPRHNLAAVAESLGIIQYISWPNQMNYFLGRLTDDDLRQMYNVMDVFCLPTKGEGFCLPIVEAQACGIPVITSNVTGGAETCKTGWLIEIDDDNMLWSPLTHTWYPNPAPSAILSKLESAYKTWKENMPLWISLKNRARSEVLEYDWDVVWPTYWVPILESLEGRLA